MQSRIKDDFDIHQDFINHEKSLNSIKNNSVQSIVEINNNIRTDIELSLMIYKQLNNFNHKCIHIILNDFSNE